MFVNLPVLYLQDILISARSADPAMWVKEIATAIISVVEDSPVKPT
jgi:hypothetical protein